MTRTSVGLLVVLAAALLPVSAPAQDPGLKERMEELHRRREERRREARERAEAAKGGAPGQAGPSAQAGAKTQAQGGAAPKAQGGAGGKAQISAAGKAGAAAKGGTGGTAGSAGESGLEALRTTRPERRRATLERLRVRWGPLLGDVRAREELRVHAERIAQLERIRALAEQKKKPKVIEQLDAVLTQEELRHAKAMNSFREGATPAAAKP